MRVLRNWDLAVDIVLDEGSIILKKYDDLDFYLKKIANGKIYNFKARQQINQMKKQYPDMFNKAEDKHIKPAYAHNRSKQTPKGKKSSRIQDSSSDNDSYLQDEDETDDLVLMARGMFAQKNDPSRLANLTGVPGQAHIYSSNRRPGNDILNVDELQEGGPRRPQYEQQNLQNNYFAMNHQTQKLGAVRGDVVLSKQFKLEEHR